VRAGDLGGNFIRQIERTVAQIVANPGRWEHDLPRIWPREAN